MCVGAIYIWWGFRFFFFDFFQHWPLLHDKTYDDDWPHPTKTVHQTIECQTDKLVENVQHFKLQWIWAKWKKTKFLARFDIVIKWFLCCLNELFLCRQQSVELCWFKFLFDSTASKGFRDWTWMNVVQMNSHHKAPSPCRHIHTHIRVHK